MSEPFNGKYGRKAFYKMPYGRQNRLREEFEWVCSLKKGDLINCCDCWNREVESVRHEYSLMDKNGCVDFSCKPEQNTIWREATVFCSDGTQFSTGGGCAAPAFSFAEVNEIHPECDERGCKHG